MTTPFLASHRSIKKQVRQQIAEHMARPKSVLLFPAKECCDVISYAQANKIDKDTFIHAVEKDPNVACSIKTTLSTLGAKYKVSVGDAYDIIRYGKSSYDFAHLDYTGMLNDKVYQSIKESQYRYNDLLAITLCCVPRARKTAKIRIEAEKLTHSDIEQNLYSSKQVSPWLETPYSTKRIYAYNKLTLKELLKDFELVYDTIYREDFRGAYYMSCFLFKRK